MCERGILDVTVSSMYCVPASSRIYTWDQVSVSLCDMCVHVPGSVSGKESVCANVSEGKVCR